MKKKLSKAVVLASVVMMLTLSLTGCSKKVECDMCGETKKCKQYEVLGEEINVCGDCKSALEDLGSMFN